jgi:hypothetical protein
VTMQEQQAIQDKRPTMTTPEMQSMQEMRLSMTMQERQAMQETILSMTSQIPDRQSIIVQPDRRSISPYPTNQSSPDLSGMIRRRSLLQPGIATRGTSVDDKNRQSYTAHSPVSTTIARSGSLMLESPTLWDQPPIRSRTVPPEAAPEKQYFDPFNPTSAPLASLAAIAARPQLPRTETPTDLRHIGGFKLGSLHITNGTASPAPTVRSNKTGGRKGNIEDDISCPGSRQRLPSVDDSAVFGKYQGDRPTLTLKFEKSYEPEQDWFSPTESSFEVGLLTEKSALQTPPSPLTPTPSPKIVQTSIQVPPPDNSLSLFRFSDSPIPEKNRKSPGRIFENAQHYRTISASPFSFEASLPNTPLEATSKHTAMEDELFEDEDELYLKRSRSSESSSGGQRFQNERPVQLLAKADSGYSSTTSRKSSRSKTLQKNGASLKSPTSRVLQEESVKPAVPAKDVLPTPPKTFGPSGPINSALPRENSPQDLFKQAHISPQTSPLPPPVPKKQISLRWQQKENLLLRPEVPPKSPTQQAAMTKFRSLSFPQPQTQSKPSAVRARQSLSSVPARPSHRSRHHSSSSESSSNPSLKKRLQRSRRASQSEKVIPAAVTIQQHQPFSPSGVPAISQSMEDRLSERSMSFPMSEHTYKTVYRSHSKETLATIFSMGSLEVSAAEAAATEAANRKMMNARISGPLPDIPVNEEVDLFVTRPEQQDPVFIPKPQPQTFVNPLGSHPVSSSRHVKNGKFQSMSSSSAAQFARERSEFRRSILRRQSLDKLQDRALVSGKLHRSKSITDNAPPVPLLPEKVVRVLRQASITKTQPTVSAVTKKGSKTLSIKVPAAINLSTTTNSVAARPKVAETDSLEKERRKWREHRESADQDLAATFNQTARSTESLNSTRVNISVTKRMSAEDLPFQRRRSSQDLSLSTGSPRTPSSIRANSPQSPGSTGSISPRTPRSQSSKEGIRETRGALKPKSKFVPSRPPPQASSRFRNLEANYLAKTTAYETSQVHSYGDDRRGKNSGKQEAWGYEYEYGYQNENEIEYGYEDVQYHNLAQKSYESLPYSAHPRIISRRASNSSIADHYSTTYLSPATPSFNNSTHNSNWGPQPVQARSAPQAERDSSHQRRKLSVEKLAIPSVQHKRQSLLRTSASHQDFRSSWLPQLPPLQPLQPLVLDRYSGGIGMGMGNGNGWNEGVGFQ